MFIFPVRNRLRRSVVDHSRRNIIRNIFSCPKCFLQFFISEEGYASFEGEHAKSKEYFCRSCRGNLLTILSTRVSSRDRAQRSNVPMPNL